jgi:hypothetical protein
MMRDKLLPILDSGGASKGVAIVFIVAMATNF